jgi:hypothetical protein
MREGQWLWHIIHTDPFANTDPTFGILEAQFAGMQTSFGVNNFDNAQGPPQK